MTYSIQKPFSFVWAIVSALVLVSSAFLPGCGGGGDKTEPETETETEAFESGYLFDSPVAGIGYESGNLSGVTNSQGRFQHEPGQPVTFSYAGLTLGPVTLQGSGEVITPIELQAAVRESYTDDVATVNLLRLLQSLDKDGDLDTGIKLCDVEGTEAGDAMANLLLDDPAFDSDAQAAINAVASACNVGVFEGTETATLVTAEKAIEHFEKTLEQIEIEPTQRSQWLVGTWEYRTEGYGEVAGKLTLNGDGAGASGTGTMEEYENCSGTDASAWVATTSRAAAICDSESHEITWTLEGQSLILDAGEFTDTCTIVSGGQHTFSTDCLIALESGTANEYQEFVRIDVNAFDERLIPGTYREFNSTGWHKESDTSTSTLNADNTGNYYVYSDGSSGNFTWSISTDGSQLILDIEGETTEVTQTFQHYIAGAVEAVEGDPFLIIPNYSGWNGGELGIQRYSVPGGAPVGSATSASPSLELDSETGEFEVLLEDDSTMICRPLHRMPTIEGGGVVFWVACNGIGASGGEFIYEIWRTL